MKKIMFIFAVNPFTAGVNPVSNPVLSNPALNPALYSHGCGGSLPTWLEIVMLLVLAWVMFWVIFLSAREGLFRFMRIELLTSIIDWYEKRLEKLKKKRAKCL